MILILTALIALLWLVALTYYLGPVHAAIRARRGKYCRLR